MKICTLKMPMTQSPSLRLCLMSIGLSQILSADAAPLELGMYQKSGNASINLLITIDDSRSMAQEINAYFEWDASNYQQYLSTPKHPVTVRIHPLNTGHRTPLCNEDNNTLWYILGNDKFLPGLEEKSKEGCFQLSLHDFPEIFNIDWRFFNGDGNTLYYNPKQTYTPWPDYAPADFTQARLYPDPSHKEYTQIINLGTLNEFPSPGFHFITWHDTAGYSGSAPTPSGYTKTANGIIDLWDNHTIYNVTNSTINVSNVSYTPNSAALAKDSIAQCQFNKNDQTLAHKCLGRSQSTNLWKNDFGRTAAQERQNIANWFQYARNRELASKHAIAYLVKKYPDINYGLTVLNNRKLSERLFMPVNALNSDKKIHQQNLTKALFREKLFGSTPLGASARFAGEYFQGKITGYDSPIKTPCDLNYHLQLTDGDRNTDFKKNYSPIGDHDKDGAKSDDYPNAASIADIASYFYNTDLALSIPNISPPTPTLCDGIKAVSHQSLISINLAFGRTDAVFDKNQCWPPGSLTTSSDWGNPFPINGNNVPKNAYMDLWHAAYNSRGYFSFFSDSKSLIERLSAFFDTASIGALHHGPTTVSQNNISPDTIFYNVEFDLPNNAGSLHAYRLDSDLSIEQLNEVWSVDALSDQANTPQIITFNPETQTGMALPRASTQAGLLTNTQIQQLFNAAVPTSSPLIPAFIDSLYQDALGPILNSNLLYVGNPSPRRQFSGSTINQDIYGEPFNQFVDQSNRRHMIYTNSNNGRLYGFDATSGTPVLTYLPNKVLSPQLLDRHSYGFKPLLDGENYVADGFLQTKNTWATILIGSMRQGGQGYFALDVTNPETFGPGNVLWEFTDKDDADLGYTYAKPAFGVFADNKWYAVLSNGYNSTATSPQDTNVSTTGEAVLYIVDLATGGLVKKFSSGRGMAQDPQGQNRPNGFAEPALVDSDLDGGIDRIYVGDFFGNLYAFDVSGTGPANWTSFFGDDTNMIPLVDGHLTNSRPITIRPVVTKLPTADTMMVIYGTGEKISTQPDEQPNYLMGVIHQDRPLQLLTDLEQRILDRTADLNWQIFNSGTGTGTGTNDDDEPLALQNGWYFHLTGDGSKLNVTSQPHLRFGQLIWPVNEYYQFDSTAVTPGATSCSAVSQQSHVIAMSPFTGRSLDQSIFQGDKNTPLEINDKAIDGIQVNAKITNLEIIATPDGEMIVGGTSGDKGISIKKMPIKNLEGRQTWRRL